MKTLTLLTMAAVLGLAATASADIVSPGRARDLAASYAKIGSAPGDKIDRAGKTSPGRAADLAASYAKSGSAGGDQIARAVQSASPRVVFNKTELYGGDVKVAPLK
ncbi:MAG: hypothetical protein AB1705_05325 [Verrucomicrobiota bacterium]